MEFALLSYLAIQHKIGGQDDHHDRHQVKAKRSEAGQQARPAASGEGLAKSITFEAQQPNLGDFALHVREVPAIREGPHRRLKK